jgi:hypothetical protein
MDTIMHRDHTLCKFRMPLFNGNSAPCLVNLSSGVPLKALDCNIPIGELADLACRLSKQ